jgi:hypothetical protein
MISAPAIYGVTATRTPTIYDRKQSAIQRACKLLESDEAVILGVESDPHTGMVYEIAAINTRGQILIDTLVNPGTPIGCRNLTDQMLAGAPSFGQVLADIIVCAQHKTIATYSSANRNAVLTSAHQHYRDAALLEDPHRWYLVAQARSEWLGEPSHYLPLQPYHRALSEAHAALTVLRTIADDHR